MKTNSKATAGPPEAAALPMVAKIPEPTIAAIPRAVRSNTVRLRLSPPDSRSYPAASLRIKLIGFFLKRSENDKVIFG